MLNVYLVSLCQQSLAPQKNSCIMIYVKSGRVPLLNVELMLLFHHDSVSWQVCCMKIRNWMRDCRQMTEIPWHWLSSHQVSYCSLPFDVVFPTGSWTANWTELWSKILITRFGMWWIYFKYHKLLRVMKKKSDHICIDQFVVLQKTISAAYFWTNSKWIVQWELT